MRAATLRRDMERHATDTPARRGLEADISRLLHQLDALATEADVHPERHERLLVEQESVAERLTTTVASLRALRLTTALN